MRITNISILLPIAPANCWLSTAAVLAVDMIFVGFRSLTPVVALCLALYYLQKRRFTDEMTTVCWTCRQSEHNG